jgi:hypothetical protein
MIILGVEIKRIKKIRPRFPTGQCDSSNRRSVTDTPANLKEKEHISYP